MIFFCQKVIYWLLKMPTRKHTPIVSKAQKRLFGTVAGGAKTKAKGLKELKSI
jgi:hypothetical protein